MTELTLERLAKLETLRAAVERKHHEAANDLLASLTWTDGDADQDLVAKAIADAEQRGYARGLADGAERERAEAADYVHAQLGDDAQETADEIRTGAHASPATEVPLCLPGPLAEQARGPWVSATLLPEVGLSVLVYRPGMMMAVARVRSNGRWERRAGDTIENVSHWRRLPVPPSETVQGVESRTVPSPYPGESE